MNTGEQQSGGFLTTLPGILSAVAAVVTAATGLIVGAGALGLIGGGNAKAKPDGQTNTASRHALNADTIAGTWSGRARQGKGAKFDVKLTIAKGCAVKQACGSVAVSGGPCFGDLSLKAVSGTRYEFSVDHFSADSAAVCKPGAGEYLMRYGDDSLLYTTGYDSSIRGVLHPPR